MRNERSAVALLDEGFLLFRRTFAQSAWIYYASSAPVALLTLWLLPRAAALRMNSAAVLQWAFLWTLAYTLRIWGTGWYKRRVLATALGAPPPTLVPRWQALLRELALRGLMLWLWSLTCWMLVGVPYLYVAAQNVALTSDGRHSLRRAIRVAWKPIGRPWQFFLLTAGFWITLSVNLAIVIVALPALAHAVFGIGGALAVGGARQILSSSGVFWMVVFAGAYLALDPVVKCAITVAFYEQELQRSGAALFSELERLSSPRKSHTISGAFAVVALAVLLLGFPCPARGATSHAAAAQSLTPTAMQQALHAELQSPPYRWHSQEVGPAWRWLSHTSTRLTAWIHVPIGVKNWVSRIFQAFVRWLNGLFGPGKTGPAPNQGPSGWRWVAWAAAALALGIAALIVLQRRRRARERAVETQPASAMTPAAIEEAAGDERAEEEWFELAARLAASGDLRLALRAAFLGALAGLAERQYITISRDRTNREYLTEFRRRARLRGIDVEQGAGVLALRSSIRQFDAVWYGDRPVTAESVASYLAQQREMLTHAA